jgi:hypothetical protein
MSTQDTTHQHKDRPKWFGAAVMLLALVLVGLLAWGLRAFLLPGSEEPAGVPAGPATPVASPSASASVSASAAATPAADADTAWDCQADLNNDATSVADAAPAVEEWVSAGYNVVPFSDFGGCQKQPSGLRVGYAPTEAGSLMAAATYSVALDPSVSEEAAQDLEVAVAEGSNRVLLGERAKRIRDGLEEGDDGSATSSLTLIGYIQNSYTETEASYQLIYSAAGSNGLEQKLAAQVDVVREDGDWKLDPASGTELISGSRYQGQPYIQWGPQS